MRSFVFFLILSTLLIPHDVEAGVMPSSQQQTDRETAIISSPGDGEALQGGVILRGSTGTAGFLSYEVDFAYADDPTQTWFLVQESTIPVMEGILAVWDTTTITDGEYALRLLVRYDDGTTLDMTVQGLRVRNYTPIETAIPQSLPSGFTPVSGGVENTPTPRTTVTPTSTPLPPRPTPLPQNPAELTPRQLGLTLGKGVAITLGVFAILGAYLGVRAMQYKRRDR